MYYYYLIKKIVYQHIKLLLNDEYVNIIFVSGFDAGNFLQAEEEYRSKDDQTGTQSQHFSSSTTIPQCVTTFFFLQCV